MKIGNRLKSLREERGLKQSDVADAIGVALSTISGYELNTRTPSVDILEKLAAFFGVTPNVLLGKEDHLSDLEEEFPEGVKVLRRANNEMTEEQKKQLVKYIDFMIDNSKG